MNFLVLYKNPDNVKSPHNIVQDGHTFTFMDKLYGQDESPIFIGDYTFIFMHTTVPSSEGLKREEIVKKLISVSERQNVIGITGGGREELKVEDFAVPVIPAIHKAGDLLALPWHLVDDGFTGSNWRLKKVLVDKRGEILISLLILSQGYISTFADYNSETGEWGPPEIKEALQDIGFSSKMSEEQRNCILQLLQNNDRRSEVRSPLWWLSPFGLIIDGQFDVTKVGKFIKLLKSEWFPNAPEQLPEKVMELLTKLMKGEEQNSPTLVAGAYLEMVNRLREL